MRPEQYIIGTGDDHPPDTVQAALDLLTAAPRPSHQAVSVTRASRTGVGLQDSGGRILEFSHPAVIQVGAA